VDSDSVDSIVLRLGVQDRCLQRRRAQLPGGKQVPCVSSIPGTVAPVPVVTKHFITYYELSRMSEAYRGAYVVLHPAAETVAVL
jgi:hypothetical protein